MLIDTSAKPEWPLTPWLILPVAGPLNVARSFLVTGYIEIGRLDSARTSTGNLRKSQTVQQGVASGAAGETLSC